MIRIFCYPHIYSLCNILSEPSVMVERRGGGIEEEARKTKHRHWKKKKSWNRGS
jgi:hypothetical protein